MKFSIVTPSFNQAQYLGVCLRSVSGQSDCDYEHVVVDGGSTDGSVELLRDYQAADERLRYVSEKDRGQGDAVNKGFAMSTGDIVAWINSDDFYFSPFTFQVVRALFIANPEANIVYGGMAWVDPAARLLHVRIPPVFNWNKLTRIAYLGNTNVFMRRDVVLKHQIDLRFHYVLDHEYMLRITHENRPVRTKNVLSCFRVQPEAKTQILTDTSKNIERRMRNEKLGIRDSANSKYSAIYDRMLYRLSLLYSDSLFLSKYRNSLPYKSFL